VARKTRTTEYCLGSRLPALAVPGITVGGLIALAIDAAGLALSGLANDLLLACYGPRFTVQIRTLGETGKADSKEGFDIVVNGYAAGLLSARVLRVPDAGTDGDGGCRDRLGGIGRLRIVR